MQIHELNTFVGAPGSSDYLAIDNGTETAKISAGDFGGCLIFKKTISSTPYSLNNAAITSNMVCVKAEFSNPSAQTSDWTVETFDGWLNVRGMISDTTDITLYLVKAKEA